MTTLRETERAKYDEMWNVTAYAVDSPGVRVLPLFLDMAKPAPGARIVDVGCGSGKAALALAEQGFDVACGDLTDEGLIEEARRLPFTEVCLWDDASVARLYLGTDGAPEWVYCCDVLEHIPTEFTMLSVANLLRWRHVGLFLSIAFEEDRMGAWIGQRLHQTIRPFVWWRDCLDTVGELIEARDLMNCGVFLVKARATR